MIAYTTINKYEANFINLGKWWNKAETGIEDTRLLDCGLWNCNWPPCKSLNSRTVD